jgi:HD-like signal output (HDOD) protein
MFRPPFPGACGSSATLSCRKNREYGNGFAECLMSNGSDLAIKLPNGEIPSGLKEVAPLQNQVHDGKMDFLPWAHLRLPPFPQIALRVLQLARDENVQLHELCDLISADPAFASEVLTVANSVLYAPHYPSSSILQAVAVLGSNTLQGMCITVGIRAYLGKTMRFPALRSLWRHNLACAVVAGRLASGDLMDKDVAYTAGILHDLGRMALAVIQPKDYGALLETHHGAPASILSAERDLFGLDHCETGRQLIGDWKLPHDFESAVFAHHSLRRTDGAWDLAEMIKVSCKMADTAGYPAFAACATLPFSNLLEELPARERRLFFSDLAPLTAHLAEAIHAIECA